MDLYSKILNNDIKKVNDDIKYIYYKDFFVFEDHIDKDNFYKNTDLSGVNEYGFRSPKFSKDIDFLIAGCSVTFGIGLPDEYTWHRLLLDKTKYTYSSVAFSGDSINGQVEKIFTYIKNFGNPKTILFLMPNLGRLKIYNKFNKFHSHFYNKKNSGNQEKYFHYQNMIKSTAHLDDVSVNDKLKYFKSPVIAEEILPQEMAHSYSSQSIHILDLYCKAAGINLLYGTWSEGSERLINKIKNENNFINFVNLNMSLWTYYKEYNLDSLMGIDCHSEYAEDELFNRAGDREDGLEWAHFGLHRHLHIKEMFLKEINRRFGYDIKN